MVQQVPSETTATIHVRVRRGVLKDHTSRPIIWLLGPLKQLFGGCQFYNNEKVEMDLREWS
jgi:hypothetical protein